MGNFANVLIEILGFASKSEIPPTGVGGWFRSNLLAAVCGVVL
jgi:hypothetical protein